MCETGGCAAFPGVKVLVIGCRLVPERSQGAFAGTMANDHDQDPEVQCAAGVFRILPRPLPGMP